ncbi:MAG TPA: TIM-barrel domain-containing protein [Thermoleophilaceae bacterium]|nr:TIM-barrel domain-containing protein [Thermoleophilaceae bacterium]
MRIFAASAVALVLAAAGSAAANHGGRSPSRIVRDGAARFEVLSPTLIRLEYAADGRFEDGPTFNVVDRGLPVPRFHTSVQHGYRVIATDKLTLRYREGSGPFTADNTSITLGRRHARTTAHPSWPAPLAQCQFGTACQAEDGRLNGGESVNYDHASFTGRGFAADYGQVSASNGWTVTGVPADGDYALQVRYANGGTVNRTLTATVDGAAAGTIDLPPTGDWDTWGVTTLSLHLKAGSDRIGTTCAAGDGCNVNVDSVALTTPSAPYPSRSTTPAPPVDEPGQLGGWTRGLDAYTNQGGADVNDVQLHPGILNRRGWSLLDDSYTALRTADGWAKPRPDHQGAYQDGYFFGYGNNYKQALTDLRSLTGPADMLPEWASGVWFSEFFPYTTDDYENKLVPAFRANNVPLDALVVDTDWKSPQQWDGWNWNSNLFPDPQAFLDWAKQQGLNVALNVHAGIDASDPKFPQAQQIAGGKLQRAAQCFSPTCYRFDWSDQDQAKAWFSLHHPFEQQGVRQWWLDWCCTDSFVGMAGLTPDSWINELYAKDIDAEGLRGFDLARLGSSFEDYRGAPPSGAWGEHRTTVHFTGDTEPTWDSLAFEIKLTAAEGAIGEPYVSHDIGSFKGKHLPDDLYARWVQFGAFQPILRLHSDHGDRLPWEYGAGQAPAADALRLREALVPYTYTLARQSVTTGIPMVRPLYLDYPDQDAAYVHPGEYLYGRDMLVAPVTTPGQVATQDVWFPPGRWIDYFTGATFDGPTTATMKVPLGRIPAFVRAGGIVPEQPQMSHVGAQPASPLTLKVYSGASGSFTLYSDAGEGLGYQHGGFAETPISYRERGAGVHLTIGADHGHYPGQLAGRAYDIALVDSSQPDGVMVNHRQLPQVGAGDTGPGWSYDAATATVHIRTATLPTSGAVTIDEIGGRAVDRAQPAAVSLAIDPPTPTTLAAGATTTVSTTVTNAGPGAISDTAVSLSAPDGWTVTPAAPAAVGTIAEGDSRTVDWNVTAPADSGGTASLKAIATYTSDANGSPGSVTVYQGPRATLPPVITSVDPTSAAAGQLETINGRNFGDTQGNSYVFFVDGGTSWGAPFDGAEFHIQSWSDTKITFTIPTPSGPGGIWHVTPGDTATVSVTTPAGSSAPASIKITN